MRDAEAEQGSRHNHALSARPASLPVYAYTSHGARAAALFGELWRACPTSVGSPG